MAAQVDAIQQLFTDEMVTVPFTSDFDAMILRVSKALTQENVVVKQLVLFHVE
jgi:hypothetical protein